MALRVSQICFALLATTWVSGLGVGGIAGAQEPLATESQGGIIVADLDEQLRAGLKIRREEEEQFVDVVIGLVEEKRLPVSLVKSVFHWSRRQNPKTPFPYFERAMRLTAARIGVEIVVPISFE